MVSPVPTGVERVVPSAMWSRREDLFQPVLVRLRRGPEPGARLDPLRAQFQVAHVRGVLADPHPAHARRLVYLVEHVPLPEPCPLARRLAGLTGAPVAR